MKKTFKIICTVVLLFFPFLKTNSLKENTENKNDSIVRRINMMSILPLTIENVISELIINEIKHIDIVLRQIIWETGHLKSYKARVDNNLFGFRRTDSTYMKFDSWSESVEYYKNWQDKRYKGGDYYMFLENVGYAEDSTYIQKLKSLKIPIVLLSK